MPQVIACPRCGKRTSCPVPAPVSLSCRGCGTKLDLARPAARTRDEPAQAKVEPRTRGVATRRGGESREPEVLSAGERLAASRALGKALRFVRALKDSYLAGAILLALPAALALWRGTLDLFSLCSVGLFVVLVIGIYRFDKRPAFWSLVLAILGTLFVGGPLLARAVLSGEGFRFGLLDVLGVVVVCGYWTAVGAARRIEATARRYPDLWIARRLHGATAEDEHEGLTTRHRDQAREERSARRRRLLVVGGAVLAAIALLVVLRPTADTEPPPPPPPEVSVDAFALRFRDAWNANRLDDVKSMFQESSRTKFSKGLDSIIRRRDWTEHLPEIGAPRFVPDGDFAAAHFPLGAGGEDGDLYTSWAYERASKTWAINALRPPPR